MQVSAKTNYAIRALLVIAAHDPLPVTAVAMAREGLPARFVENILGELRRGELVRSRRGRTGGYTLTRPAELITLGQILRVVDGPLSDLHGLDDEFADAGTAAHLRAAWEAVIDSVAELLDAITVAQVLAGDVRGPERVA
jgi:Rrf2 family protein